MMTAAHPARAQNYYNEDTAPAAGSDADSQADAGAQGADVPASHTVVVTSIEKCYAQLSRADALDIEQHYLKPYEECQRRLALKLKQQHNVKAGQRKTGASARSEVVTPQYLPQNQGAPNQNIPNQNSDGPPDNPGRAAPPLSDEGLYYRVQKNKLPQPPPADNGQ